MDWTDSGGRHTGNLATFNSTADYSTVASIQLSIGPNITSFSGILYLPLLNYVDFSGNNISVDVVNDILVGLAINGLLNGYVDLSGQTPAAPPSVGPPDGIAAKAYLSSLLGWTISTD